MPWFRARNFFDSLRPVYFATRIFLMYFETLDFKQRTIHRTLLDQMLFIAAVLVDLGLIYRNVLFNTPYLHLTDSVLLNVGSFLTLFSLAILTSSIAVWNGYKSAEIFEIYATIDECDRKLRMLGIVIDHRKQHKFSTMFLLGWMCFPVIITWRAASDRFGEAWTSVDSAGPNPATVVAILRISIGFSLFICYSSLTLLSINQRLDCVQKAMARHLEASTSSQLVIQRIANVHDRLSDTIRLFNSCYSIQVVHIVTTNIFFTIFNVFGLIHAYAVDANEAIMEVARSNFLYGVIHVLMFVVLTVFTSLVGRNSNRIAVAIHKTICYGSYDKQVFRELRRFSQQLEQHVQKISCGMFDFGWELFYSAIGTFATYLVILLQFDVGNLDLHHR